MNSFLLNRASDTIHPRAFERAQTTRLINALQPAPRIRFSGERAQATTQQQRQEQDGSTATELNHVQQVWAHRAGVNTITIDRFEGRYLLSGGADASIKTWDLEAAGLGPTPSPGVAQHEPLVSVTKSNGSSSSFHKFGITHLSFYPFDSLAYISSSYDHTLKLSSSETLQPSASFDLGSVVYSHATSPIASHILVACATQHPAVRLVDLRSGSSTHSLAGHAGAVLSVGWSPTAENVLASGGTDGSVRLWDIRRSAAALASFDLEDSVGIEPRPAGGVSSVPRRRYDKAHNGAVNGLVWTEDGRHIASVAHDEKIRVWDVQRQANTLAAFGPAVKNRHLSTLLPLLAPRQLLLPSRDIMFYPNEKELLMFDLLEGTLLKRLRVPGTSPVATRASGTASKGRNVRERITSLSWRGTAHDVELYSAHGDGLIRLWRPWTQADALAKEEEEDEQGAGAAGEEGEDRKRKRETLEGIYRDLMGQKITFS